MKKIDTYIIEKFKINKDIKIKSNDGYSEDAVTRDFRKIYKLISEIDGKHSELLDYVVDMLVLDIDDEDSPSYYEFDESKFYSLFRAIVNYDFISLYGGKVNIKESNHPDLAKILKKYATPKIIKQTMDSFGWS